MKKITLYLILFLLFNNLYSESIQEWFDSVFEKRGGNIGFAIFKIPVSARCAAMGGTYVASAQPYEAISSNPAKQILNGKYFVFNHQNHFQGIHQEYFGFLFGNNKYSLGISLRGLFADGFEYRTKPGPSEGSFSCYDFINSVTLAYKLYSDFSIGIRTNIIHEKIFEYSTTLISYDFGFYFSPFKIISFGATMENLGPKFTYKKNSENFSQLPTGWRIGTMISLPNFWEIKEVIAFDVWKTTDVNIRYDLGCELQHNSGLSLRFGGRFNSDTQGFTTGFGYNWKNLIFNYSFSPYSLDLGNSHNISLGILL